MNLTTKLVIILAVLLSIVIGGVTLSIAEIYKNYGLIRAKCPNGYCSPIPQGMSGISFGIKYGDNAEWEALKVHCNKVFPKPCSSEEVIETNQCESDGMIYTSSPSQLKCKKCDKYWTPSREEAPNCSNLLD